MPHLEVTVSCPVYDSFRVQQVAGLFDVPLSGKAQATFAVEVPGADEAWQIGLIVGPSGSGKTSIARRAFGPSLVESRPWPDDRAVIDCFGDLPVRDITSLLTAVGFGSPPAWVKPYAVLSGGEKFRCDLALCWPLNPPRHIQDPHKPIPPLRPASWSSTNSPASSIGGWHWSARPRSAGRFALASSTADLSP